MSGVWTDAQRDKVNDAEIFAKAKHAKQFRKDGSPYIGHCRRVAEDAVAWSLRRLAVDAEQLVNINIAALLHDSVEDQDVSVEELEERYGYEVATMVRGLSNRKDIENSVERLQEYCARLHWAKHEIVLIKLADLRDNATSKPPSPSWALGWAGIKAPKMLDAIHAQCCLMPEYIETVEAVKAMHDKAEKKLLMYR